MQSHERVIFDILRTTVRHAIPSIALASTKAVTIVSGRKTKTTWKGIPSPLIFGDEFSQPDYQTDSRVQDYLDNTVDQLFWQIWRATIENSGPDSFRV